MVSVISKLQAGLVSMMLHFYLIIFIFYLCRYVMRAIYIAKGSPLLPPEFASIFDDLASSSLDVFFDPSSGLVKLPGLTLGITNSL